MESVTVRVNGRERVVNGVRLDDGTVLVNCTPHTIDVYVNNEKILSIPPSGIVTRVQVQQTVQGSLRVRGRDIPVVQNMYGRVADLPEPAEGQVRFIVSLLVLQAVRRFDLLAPDTGPSAVRRNGQIAGIRQFVKG